MDVVKPFKDSWEIYSKNFITIFLSLIGAIALSCITLGILMMPLLVGFMMQFVKAKRGQAIAFNDIFEPIGAKYWPLTLAGLWTGLLTSFGFALLILPGLCWSAWWLYTYYFIADKNLGIGAAMRASKDLVRKNDIWMHIVFIILVGAVVGVGSSVPLAGPVLGLLLLPISLGAISCAYVEEAK